MGTLLSIWTVLVFVFFIGVVIWVLGPKRTKEFEEAANIPFQEEEWDSMNKGKKNG